MLNEYLNKVQPECVEIQDCKARVSVTGIESADSANLGARRLAKARIQRMRRRQQRSFSASNRPMGWVARFA